MKLIILPICLGTFSALFSCSSDVVESKDVNEEQVFRSYNVTHDAGTRSTYMSAQYRVGGATGTTVRLTEPSHVNVSGAPLLINDNNATATRTLFTGAFYSSSQIVESPDHSYTFIWSRKDGSQVSDQINLAAPVYATSLGSGDAIRRNHDLDIILDLSVSAADESVTAQILATNIATSEGSVRLATATTSYGNVIHIPAADLQKLASGEAQLTLQHHTYRTMPRSSQSLGGAIESAYVTTPLTFKLVD